jgi:gamma-glutamyltranspeptidase
MSNLTFSRFILIFFLVIIVCTPARADEPVAVDQGMVVSEQKLASLIGLDILQAGGNAVVAL